MSDKGIFWKMYAHLAGCLVQAEAGCESFGVGGCEGVGGVWTACADVCGVRAASGRRLGGVQIWDVRRNGRHVLEWAASRFEMWGGMDAMCWSERRPDLRCGAEWTPRASEGGVQI